VDPLATAKPLAPRPQPRAPVAGESPRPWLFFAATSVFHFLADNEADNDLWVHLLLGRRMLSGGGIPRVDDLSFTATGAPWVDHEWLLQVIFAFIFDWLGAGGLWLVKVGVGVLTAWLLWRSVRRGGLPVPLQVFVMVLVLAALSRGFSIRPQIVTYLFTAALLAWLDARRDRPIDLRFAMPLMAVWMCAWSNLHGGFIVGLGILGLWSVSPPWNGLPARLALPAVGLLGACINPYGPSLFTYIWGELSVPHPLTEWQPVAFGDPAQFPFWTMLIACALTLPFARLLRQSPWRAALLIGTAVLALRHQRHVPLFAICAAAPLADQMGNALARFRPPELSLAARRIVAASVLAIALMQLGLLVSRIAGDGATIVYDAGEYPVGAVRYLRDRELEGDVALPLDWGGYALWHLTPRVRVSMDGRFATVYPPPVVAENFDLFAGVSDRLLKEHLPDYVLTAANVTMHALPGLGYRPVYRDSVAILHARGAPGPATEHQAPAGRIAFP